jgi:hypothetical protein
MENLFKEQFLSQLDQPIDLHWEKEVSLDGTTLRQRFKIASPWPHSFNNARARQWMPRTEGDVWLRNGRWQHTNSVRLFLQTPPTLNSFHALVDGRNQRDPQHKVFTGSIK